MTKKKKRKTPLRDGMSAADRTYIALMGKYLEERKIVIRDCLDHVAHHERCMMRSKRGMQLNAEQAKLNRELYTDSATEYNKWRRLHGLRAISTQA